MWQHSKGKTSNASYIIARAIITAAASPVCWECSCDGGDGCRAQGGANIDCDWRVLGDLGWRCVWVWGVRCVGRRVPHLNMLDEELRHGIRPRRAVVPRARRGGGQHQQPEASRKHRWRRTRVKRSGVAVRGHAAGGVIYGALLVAREHRGSRASGCLCSAHAPPSLWKSQECCCGRCV